VRCLSSEQTPTDGSFNLEDKVFTRGQDAAGEPAIFPWSVHLLTSKRMTFKEEATTCLDTE